MGNISTSPIVAALLERLAFSDTILVGDAEQPEGSGWQGVPGNSDFIGYIVLHTNFTSDVDGTLADPYDYVAFEFQPTCVGATREQAGVIADKVREALVGDPLIIPNRSAMLVAVDSVMGVRRDDSSEHHVFISTDRYCVHVVPSTGT